MQVTVPEADLHPDRRPFLMNPTVLKVLRDRNGELLLSGPAGTGKSRTCLEKLHACATKYPGMRGLIVRKTRDSLTESGLVTFEQKVLPVGHPALSSGGQRRLRQAYHYPNGSTLVVGGLDKPSRTLSTEYDIVYVQEAIELTENEWELLTRPLRNGRMPYQQLIADTNPDTPTHWLKKRCDNGQTRLIDTRHEDNPTIWDAEKQGWTPEGEKYLQKLDNMTGPRKLRLRYGRWVQAEGVVYEEWDRAVHLIDRFDIPAAWSRYLSIDFGFTNAFVCQWWAKDEDDRLFRYREIYHAQRLVEDHAKLIRELSQDEPAPAAVICDHDAEGRATLEKYLGRSTVPAVKAIEAGVQHVAARLRKAGDGRGRLFLLRDSLVERDSGLVELKLPTCTEEEFDGYVWDLTNNRKKGEVPIDKNNHGMDGLRYMVAHLDGSGRVPFTAPSQLPEREQIGLTARQQAHAAGLGANESGTRRDREGGDGRSGSAVVRRGLFGVKR
ncbi:MAG: phage terminase large subunit [Acidobacteriaceae bacterium]|nr:phage terminase large subunit [Acidobacteriaceae bacterium]